IARGQRAPPERKPATEPPQIAGGDLGPRRPARRERLERQEPPAEAVDRREGQFVEAVERLAQQRVALLRELPFELVADAPLELAGRLLRERDRRDPARRHAARENVHEPCGEDAGLAGA